MKLTSAKLAFILCQFVFFSLSTSAQYTETFESQPSNLSTFNSNSQPFTLTGSFLIFGSRGGLGYQHSNRFIDNGSFTNVNEINSIKTTDGKPINVKSLWLFVSKDGGGNPSIDGSVIITGKLGGVTKFTITKTTGFSPTFVPDNGFTYINLVSEGGVNNSNINIDELVFQLQGNFDYIAIDNFTYTPLAVLPLSLVSYTASLQPNGQVKLNWQTAFENNVKQFIISKSADGRMFQTEGIISATGNSSSLENYSLVDKAPYAGTNFYRLEEVDMNGAIKSLGIKTVMVVNRFYKPTVFPNPATGETITLRSEVNPNTSSSYIISDFAGRIIKKGNITSSEQPVNISGLSSGNYSIRMSNGEVVNWIKN